MTSSGQELNRSGLSVEFKRHLVSSFVANLILPVFYLFLPLLAYKLGATVLEIGLVGGAANAVYSFMPFIMGHYSDRRGARKFFIASSFVILVVVSLLYVVISSPVALIVTRIFEGIGWAMLWPAIEAAISIDIAGDSRRSLSIFNLTWSAAAAVGPLFGSLLVFLVSIRFAFMVTCLVALATLILNLAPILRPKSSGERRVDIAEVHSIQSPQRDVRASFYLLATALSAVSSGVIFTFFSPFARSIGISVLLIGVITFVYGFTRFLVYVLTTRERFRSSLLKPSGRVRNVILALVIMSVSSLPLTFRDHSGLIYLASYAVIGAGYSIVYAISQIALVAEVSPSKAGRGAGLFESSIGLGASLSPIVAGIISGGSLTTPFLVPSLSLLLVLAIFPVLLKK